MDNLSALNNSSITDEMTLDDILAAADARIEELNGEREQPTQGEIEIKREQWRTMAETARAMLPEAIKPFVNDARGLSREDQPNEAAVAIDLPGCARIFFGPWVWIEQRNEYEVAEPWRNKPFQVAGGNMEEFGDLLDAIARAREVFRHWQDRNNGMA